MHGDDFVRLFGDLLIRLLPAYLLVVVSDSFAGVLYALIRRIEVHSKDKETKKVKVDIYFTAVGLFSIPTEKEIQAAMEEIRQNPQQFKLSA